jgi:asparagine synthase (glutamine-hydrolysing)
LVELAFALPETQRFSRGYGKFILREAMKGLLPEEIRLRRSKSDLSPIFPVALESEGGESLFSDLALGHAGWVFEREVKSMYKRMIRLYKNGSTQYTDDIWPLATIAGMELWYRSVGR